MKRSALNLSAAVVLEQVTVETPYPSVTAHAADLLRTARGSARVSTLFAAQGAMPVSLYSTARATNPIPCIPQFHTQGLILLRVHSRKMFQVDGVLVLKDMQQAEV